MNEKQNQINKKYRLKKHIKEILNKSINNTFFITLTFNNKTLKKTNEQTRLRYIKEYLNNQTEYYILNKDYGNKNNREHYHALVISYSLINLNLYNQKYGDINIKRINKYKNQKIDTITKYLLNHFLKETSTKQIIFSRKKTVNHRSKIIKSFDKTKQKIKEPIKEVKTQEPIFNEKEYILSIIKPYLKKIDINNFQLNENDLQLYQLITNLNKNYLLTNYKETYLTLKHFYNIENLKTKINDLYFTMYIKKITKQLITID